MRKYMLQITIIIIAISGAFATSKAESSISNSTPITGYTDPLCTMSIECSTTGEFICADINGQQAFAIDPNHIDCVIEVYRLEP